MAQAPRHQLNVVGPFYVLEGQCITCGAPEHAAPTLMSSDEDGHCYFHRQPATPAETDRAIRALFLSCCGAVRYAGEEPEVLRRLAELGEAESCDHPPPEKQVPVHRNVATFGFDATAEEALAWLQTGIVGLGERHRVERLPRKRGRLGLGWSWYDGLPGVEIHVEPGADDPGRWLLTLSREGHPVPTGAALTIDDLLKAEAGIHGVRWYTAEDWEQDRSRWTELPY